MLVVMAFDPIENINYSRNTNERPSSNAFVLGIANMMSTTSQKQILQTLIQIKIHQKLNFVQGLAMPVVMVFGLVGNVLSIIVLRSPAIDMKVTRREQERKTDSAEQKNTLQYNLTLGN